MVWNNFLRKLQVSDICFQVAHDYLDIVNSFPFSSTLVAANASYSASDISGLSATSVNMLLKITMETIVPTTIAFVSCFYTFFDEELYFFGLLVSNPRSPPILLLVSSREGAGADSGSGIG